MDIAAEETRDNIRDLVAMLAACQDIHHGDGSRAADLAVLLEHADAQGCLKVSVSWLATALALLSGIWARHRGTCPEEEIQRVLDTFRSAVT